MVPSNDAMTDASPVEPVEPVEPVAQDPGQRERWPWWMYATLGFFALGVAAATLGVRTCL